MSRPILRINEAENGVWIFRDLNVVNIEKRKGDDLQILGRNLMSGQVSGVDELQEGRCLCFLIIPAHGDAESFCKDERLHLMVSISRLDNWQIRISRNLFISTGGEPKETCNEQGEDNGFLFHCSKDATDFRLAVSRRCKLSEYFFCFLRHLKRSARNDPEEEGNEGGDYEIPGANPDGDLFGCTADLINHEVKDAHAD